MGNRAMSINIRTTQKTYPISVADITRRVRAMLEAVGYSGFSVSIWFTTDATIRRYNRDFRQKDKATDILSFPFHPHITPGERIIALSRAEKNLGDMIISLEYVARTAYKWERDFDTHLTALLAHGIAHLLNYDHITDEQFAEMEPIEQRCIAAVAAARIGKNKGQRSTPPPPGQRA